MNPYDQIDRPPGRAGAGAAGAVLVGAAGLLVLGSGVAAADPMDDGASSEFAEPYDGAPSFVDTPPTPSDPVDPVELDPVAVPDPGPAVALDIPLIDVPPPTGLSGMPVPGEQAPEAGSVTLTPFVPVDEPGLEGVAGSTDPVTTGVIDAMFGLGSGAVPDPVASSTAVPVVPAVEDPLVGFTPVDGSGPGASDGSTTPLTTVTGETSGAGSGAAPYPVTEPGVDVPTSTSVPGVLDGAGGADIATGALPSGGSPPPGTPGVDGTPAPAVEVSVPWVDGSVPGVGVSVPFAAEPVPGDLMTPVSADPPQDPTGGQPSPEMRDGGFPPADDVYGDPGQDPIAAPAADPTPIAPGDGIVAAPTENPAGPGIAEQQAGPDPEPDIPAGAVLPGVPVDPLQGGGPTPGPTAAPLPDAGPEAEASQAGTVSPGPDSPVPGADASPSVADPQGAAPPSGTPPEGGAGGPDQKPWWTQLGFASGAFDKNLEIARGRFPLRGTSVNENEFRPRRTLLSALTPAWLAEMWADERVQEKARTQRETALQDFGRRLDTIMPVGAQGAHEQLTRILEGQRDAEMFGHRFTVRDITPEAREAYLCLLAMRCQGAPAEASVHAAAALAALLGSTGEMPPDGVAAVQAASERGLRDLDRAGALARSMLPDARLTPSSDPRTALVLEQINEIAVPGASADLFAALQLPGMHPQGPDGTARIAPVPGLPPEISGFGLYSRHLSTLHDGTIPPAELATLETWCQEAARAVCDIDFRIPGSTAGPNELPDPQRVADLAALNSALHHYWAEFQKEAEGATTLAAWAEVERAQERLQASMRRNAPTPVETAPAEPAPAETEPAETEDAEPGTAPPNEIARLTAQAQTGPLHTLYSHLPGRTRPDGKDIRERDFVQGLLGAPRFLQNLYTFPDPPAETAHDPWLSEPDPGPATTWGAEPEPPDEESEPTGSTGVEDGRRTSGGGLVLVPELPRPEDPIGDLIAGGRPAPDPSPPDLRPTPEPPPDPDEFGPNPSPRDEVPVGPARPGSETFPGRDEELERTLAPSGVPGLRTFPLGQEELPEEPPAGSSAGRTVTAPIPSDPEARGTVAVASPALTSQAPTPGPALRYAPTPDGGRGVVTGVQEFAGAGPRSTPGSATTVRDPRTGVESVSVRPSTIRNGDGTTRVFLPEIAGARVGYNPAGRTALVVELGPGQSGRVTPQTPVTELVVRTGSAPPLMLNGGGDPMRSVPGVVYRDPHPDRPTDEIVTVVPARYVDPVTGRERLSAKVPAGSRDVDLGQLGPIRFDVPAGTELVEVIQTRQAFTPAPVPSAVRRAVAAPAPAAVPARTTSAPAPRGAPSTSRSQPVVTQPVVTQPVVTQPVVTQPVVTQPVVTQPVVTQPVVTQPVVTQPVVTQPVVTQPVVTQPVVTQPVVPRPVGQQPVARQQVVAPRPVAPQPVVRQPVAQSPVARQPAAALPVVRPSPVAAPQPNPVEQAVDWGRRNVVGPLGDAWNRTVAGAQQVARDFILDVRPFEGFPELTYVETVGGLGVYDALGRRVHVERGDPPSTVPVWRLRLAPAVPGGGIGVPVPGPGGVPLRIPVLVR